MNLISANRYLRDPEVRERTVTITAALRALRDDFPVLPHIERRSIHSRGTPRGFFGANQGALDARSELRISIQILT